MTAIHRPVTAGFPAPRGMAGFNPVSPWVALFVLVSLGPAAGETEPAAALQGPATPFTWLTASPESQGLSSAKLETFRDEMAARSTLALLIVRNDRIVYEWYAQGASEGSKLGTASTAKGLFGGMAAAVELGDGLIRLDDPASRFIPQWRADPLKSRITLRELGSHTSGLDDAEENAPAAANPSGPAAAPKALAHDKLMGWKGDFWKRLPVPHDPFTISRDVVPVVFAPGERFSYSNPGIAMLGYALTAALREAPQKDLRTLVRDRVMRAIGVGDDEWEAGYKQTFDVDGLPLVPAWGGGGYTARATARIARLMLREGDWDGRRILTREAVRAVSHDADAGLPGDVAIGWWINNKGAIPEMPRDAFFALGAGHRLVVVIPSLNIIVVRNGELLSSTEPFMEARNRLFFTPLMDALDAAQPRGRPQ
jgi:CubicO group peptidase (beta-lactamase class C family)